jgi:pimeloyl-ACP methyl ester carboxylesterase
MTAAVQPFRLRIPESALDDLRERLHRARWPEPATVEGWAQGVPLPELRELCAYWADGYDWRATEARLNTLGQFRSVVDGLGIHGLHVRSPHADAMPLVLTHGWPGSVVEFLGVIGPLTDPVAHGGRAEDAFHVVCPSLPGYGFSDRPTEPGWGVARIADAWAVLMTRLGYDRFGAQGGDWGTSVTACLGLRHPGRLTGIHLTPPLVAPDPETAGDRTDAERRALADMARAGDDGGAYGHVHATRPQTIGYGLVDSPVALAAWIVEKLGAWTDHDGCLWDLLSRDEVLDNLMLYWLPGTGASAARLYWESLDHVEQTLTRPPTDTIDVPTGCSVFPRENPRPSRRWAERRFTDIRHWGEPERGGHFAAFEQPAAFVAELRAFFALVR